MKTINLSQHEATAAVRGNLRFLIRPCKQASATHGKFTEHAYAVYPTSESGWIAWFGWYEANNSGGKLSEFTHGFKAPFAPGDILTLREAWYLLYVSQVPKVSDAGIKYRADYDGCLPWKSASIMPKTFARFTATVEAVECKRVSEITEEEAEGAGAICLNWMAKVDFECNWLKRYPGFTWAFLAHVKVERV